MSNFNSLFLQPRYHRWLKRVVAEPGSTHAAGSSVAATSELGRACSDALQTWAFHCCRQPKYSVLWRESAQGNPGAKGENLE